MAENKQPMSASMLQQVTEQSLIIIRARGAVTSVDLVITVAANVYPLEFNTHEYFQVLENMVKQGAIHEVEYVLPSMPDRVKSVFFPAGTRIKVR